jgi:hypothetical protein
MSSKQMPGKQKPKPDAAKIRHQKPINQRLTVGDCLKWSTEESATEKNIDVWADHKTTNSQQLQRNCDSHCKQPNDELRHNRQQREAEGTAGEALRGWPRLKGEQEEQRNKENDEKAQARQSFGGVEKKTERKTKTGASINHGRQSTITKGSEDADIADLLSQKYLEEHIRRTQMEMLKEENNRMADEQSQRSSHHGAKPNKATKLRSIAINGKLHAEPVELWKMPRFTKNARARVTTTAGPRHANNESQENNVQYYQHGSIDADDADILNTDCVSCDKLHEEEIYE